MRNSEIVLVAAALLATLAGSAVAGSSGAPQLPIGHDGEATGYNKCERIGVDLWGCTTCYSSETYQQSVCIRQLTDNPGPQSP